MHSFHISLNPFTPCKSPAPWYTVQSFSFSSTLFLSILFCCCCSFLVLLLAPLPQPTLFHLSAWLFRVLQAFTLSFASKLLFFFFFFLFSFFAKLHYARLYCGVRNFPIPFGEIVLLYRFSFSLFLSVLPYSPAQLTQSWLNLVVYVLSVVSFALLILCAVVGEQVGGAPPWVCMLTVRACSGRPGKLFRASEHFQNLHRCFLQLFL